MLKEILAITGKPGLFRIVSHSGKTLIVEDLLTDKKFPVSMRDRVVSLGDIAMYTDNGEKPLGEILDLIFTAEKGKPLDIKEIAASVSLKGQFEKYLPDFDRDRVHDSDVKKLFSWYNLLVGKGFDKFTETQDEKKNNEEEQHPA
ncbi:MAG: DUF5606 domain-containing protein [Muribaculaceae bacterium]|nr:DUF5606 domain-containing protein [Muribaculaceae bacterium]